MEAEKQELKNQMAEDVRRNFHELDLNGDGFVSKAELFETFLSDEDFQFPASIMGNSRQEKMDAFFARLDANSDGKLTQEEVIAGLHKMVDEFYAAGNEF